MRCSQGYSPCISPPLLSRFGRRLAMTDYDWMRDAACRGTETNLFFGDRGDHKTMKTAMEICNGTRDTPACPVRTECRDWAMSHPDDNFGIFGGLTPSARLQLRRKRNKDWKPVELSDSGLPTDYEWRLGLRQLVRLVHEAVLDDENKRRAKQNLGPIKIAIR